LESVVEALQILDPDTFGDDLIRPNRKFVYWYYGQEISQATIQTTGVRFVWC
jgi:hypothetical protein